MKQHIQTLAKASLALLIAVTAVFAASIQAQDFPTKSVRIITPFPVGSGPEGGTGTEMQHVLFKETSQLYTSVANGELQFSLGTNATSGALQHAGKIRFLAVAAPRRIQAFPDVQTVTEQGGSVGFEVSGWTAIAAPRGLPKAVSDKIQRDVAEALGAADIKEKYVTFGYESFPQTREQFNQYIGTESTRFADIIKTAKASLD